jgi:hypothetical protein
MVPFDEEDCSLFLPDVIQAGKQNEHRDESFCESWMIHYILLMIIIAGVIAAKV